MVVRYVLAFKSPSIGLQFLHPSLLLETQILHLRSFQVGRLVIESRPCLLRMNFKGKGVEGGLRSAF